MNAIKLITSIDQKGKIKLPKLPYKKGTKVEVIILEVDKGFNDLLKASETSLSFWDNPIDDEIWNEA